MNAIVEGEGEVLLMLHGFLCSKEIFSNQIAFFSKFYKVVALDFLGYNNQPMEWDYSLDDYVNFVKNAIFELGQKEVNILAHSFGCRVAIKLMATTNFVKSAVLTGSAGLKPKFSLKKFLKIKLFKLAKFLNLKVANKMGSLDYKKLSPIQKRSFVKIVNCHLDDLLPKINARVLIYHGKFDRETPLYMAKKINEKVKNSTLFIADGGHFAFLENSNQFNYLVKEFL